MADRPLNFKGNVVNNLIYKGNKMSISADLSTVPGTCGIGVVPFDDESKARIRIFDGEAYHPKSGKIISKTYRGQSDEIKEFLYMFFKQEDWDRIKKWDELGINKWGRELYEREE